MVDGEKKATHVLSIKKGVMGHKAEKIGQSPENDENDEDKETGNAEVSSR